MPTLSLPSNLLRMTAPPGGRTDASRGEISLAPGPWDEFTEQLRARFPELSQRVLVESGDLARGFALVVNGCPVRDCRSARFEGDESLAIIPYIAGG